MTKEQVVKILKGMDFQIAQVQISFTNNGKIYNEDVIVYLVSEPLNEDQIIMANHWWIFHNINDFDENITKIINVLTNGTSKQIDFINVRRFISDFKDEIDPVKDAVIEQTDEEKTIQWYKVKCSLFKEEFGVRLWKDLMDFMSKTIGFDYTITGQYTKPYTGVEGYYENGHIIKL